MLYLKPGQVADDNHHDEEPGAAGAMAWESWCRIVRCKVSCWGVIYDSVDVSEDRGSEGWDWKDDYGWVKKDPEIKVLALLIESAHMHIYSE